MAARREAGRDGLPFEVTMGSPGSTSSAPLASADDVRRWQEVGATRLVVTPPDVASADAIVGFVKRFADDVISNVG